MAKATENYGFTAAQIKAAGVSAAMLTLAAGALKRHGTGKHMALAMYLSPKGATQQQVIKATGDTQVNVARDLINAGLAKGVDVARSEGGHKVYKLTLTAKPAKVKPARKAASKGKGKPAAPAGDTASA
jgi:hypothetical protein